MPRRTLRAQVAGAVAGISLGVLFAFGAHAEGFTAEQAAAGKDKFAQNCQGCHGDDLTGRSFFPPITGDRFMSKWQGRTAAQLLTFMSTRMPNDRPGGLAMDDYTDILAYWLSFNGYTPGGGPLTNDPARLGQITIEPQG